MKKLDYIQLYRSKSECQVSDEFNEIQREIAAVIRPHIKRIRPRDLLAAETVFCHAIQTEVSLARLWCFAKTRETKRASSKTSC